MHNTYKPSVHHMCENAYKSCCGISGGDGSVRGPKSPPTPLVRSAKPGGTASQFTLPNVQQTGNKPTPVSQAGFKKGVPDEAQELVLLSVEIHTNCRQAFVSTLGIP